MYQLLGIFCLILGAMAADASSKEHHEPAKAQYEYVIPYPYPPSPFFRDEMPVPGIPPAPLLPPLGAPRITAEKEESKSAAMTNGAHMLVKVKDPRNPKSWLTSLFPSLSNIKWPSLPSMSWLLPAGAPAAVPIPTDSSGRAYGYRTVPYPMYYAY